jgi:hypothetical protein
VIHGHRRCSMQAGLGHGHPGPTISLDMLAKSRAALAKGRSGAGVRAPALEHQRTKTSGQHKLLVEGPATGNDMVCDVSRLENFLPEINARRSPNTDRSMHTQAQQNKTKAILKIQLDLASTDAGEHRCWRAIVHADSCTAAGLNLQTHSSGPRTASCA